MLAQNLPTSASEYSRAQRAEIQAAVAAVKRQWHRMGDDFDAGWARIAPTVVAIMATAQSRIVDQADLYVPAVLEETGQLRAIEATAATNRAAFIGVTGAGYAVSEALSAAPVKAKQAIASGATVAEAIQAAGTWLTGSTGTILSDTGRAVEATGMYTHGVSGYVRMLTPPSCARCVIQAGKWFRANQGFERHPGCDCRHIPIAEAAAGDLRLNPADYFDSLDGAGKLKLAGSKANLRAIEDGADIGQIVNAYHRTAGMAFAQESSIVTRYGNKYTTAGTTRRSQAYQQQLGLRRNGKPGPRLMPETIYRTSATRDEALRKLHLYGWISDPDAVARGRVILADQRRIARNERRRARRAATSGAGGGSKPPSRPPLAGASGEPGPDDKAYWRARQDAIGVDFKGDVLKPHEIRSVERFLAAGERLEWIATDPTGVRSTNDFIWLSNGNLPTELKSTKAKYGTIMGRIHEAVEKSSRKGTPKRYFLIDIADEDLTSQLATSLAGYNRDRSRYPIRRLWVMSRGVIREIDLRN